MEGTIGPAGDPNEPYQAPSSHPVVEINNLVIPSGTLWRSEAHLLESFDLHDSYGVAWAFLLELADPLPAGHLLRLDLGDSQNSHDSNDPISNGVSPGSVFSIWSGYDIFWSIRGTTPDPPLPFTGYVQIVTAGPGPGDNPTTSDITIVRGRAAFEVI